jgi:hypothetical protein
MTPTMCGRCGGLLDLCECADLRREAYAHAAKIAEWEVANGDPYRIAARIRTLARKPERL